MSTFVFNGDKVRIWRNTNAHDHFLWVVIDTVSGRTYRYKNWIAAKNRALALQKSQPEKETPNV